MTRTEFASIQDIVEGNDCRIETRATAVNTHFARVQARHAPQGSSAIAKVAGIGERQSKPALETPFYDLLRTRFTADYFGEVVSQRWGVENGLPPLLPLLAVTLITVLIKNRTAPMAG